MRYSLPFLLLLLPVFILAQGITGRVDDAMLGFGFTVPQGWEATQTGNAYFMASNSQKGLLLVSAGDLTTVAELKADLQQPVREAAISLDPTSDPETIGEGAVGCLFEGRMQGIPTKGYAVNFLTDSGKSGTVFAAVEASSYTDAYRELAVSVFQTVGRKYTTSPAASAPSPVQAGDLGNAANLLKGYQLAAISTAGGYGSTGYRKKEVIHFCANGSFTMYSDEAMVVNGDMGGSAADGSSGTTRGTWAFNREGQQYMLNLTIQGNTGQLPVRVYRDSYGDTRFEINGGKFGYYGEAQCR